MLSQRQFYNLIQEAIEKALNVDSSNIKDMIYDTDRKELAVTFQNNRKYLYSQVPIEMWNAIQNAGSKGKFFFEEIRMVFPFKEITDMMNSRYNRPGGL